MKASRGKKKRSAVLLYTIAPDPCEQRPNTTKAKSPPSGLVTRHTPSQCLKPRSFRTVCRCVHKETELSAITTGIIVLLHPNTAPCSVTAPSPGYASRLHDACVHLKPLHYRSIEFPCDLLKSNDGQFKVERRKLRAQTLDLLTALTFGAGTKLDAS